MKCLYSLGIEMLFTNLILLYLLRKWYIFRYSISLKRMSIHKRMMVLITFRVLLHVCTHLFLLLVLAEHICLSLCCRHCKFWFRYFHPSFCLMSEWSPNLVDIWNIRLYFDDQEMDFGFTLHYCGERWPFCALFSASREYVFRLLTSISASGL